MKNKTIKIEVIKAKLNSILELSRDTKDNPSSDRSMVDFRQGVCCALEDILHISGNYKGFSYLSSAKVVKPCTKDMTIADETRRVYH